MDANQGGTPLFRVNVRNGGGSRIIEVAGELDLASADQFEAQLLPAARDASHHLVVDLRGLAFMDSTGIKSLLRAAQLRREVGGRLSLVRGQHHVQRVLEISGLEQHFEFVDGSDPMISGGQVEGSASKAS